MSLGEYFVPLIIISALVGIMSHLSYRGASDRVLRFAVSVLVLYTALFPVLGVVGELSSTDFESIFEDIRSETDSGSAEYIKVSEEAFKEGICKLLVTKYNIKSENIRIYVFGFDFEKMRAEQVKILLSGKSALADTRRIEEYLNSLSLGKFEVNIEL